jgi:hypothetical protein
VNAGWVRTLALWRAMRVGYIALLLMELAAAASVWVMLTHPGDAAQHKSFGTNLAFQVLLAGFLPLLAGAGTGVFLPLMPGPRWLRAANRRWLWQCLLGGAALQWLIVGLPTMLLNWPQAPVTATVVSLAAVGGAWIFGIALLVLVPPHWRAIFIAPFVALGWLAQPLSHLDANTAQTLALVVGVATCALAGLVLRPVVRRLCDPQAPAVPVPNAWAGAGTLWGDATAVVQRQRAPGSQALVELVMPLSPAQMQISRRNALKWLAIAAAMVWLFSQVDVSADMALRQCLWGMWPIASLSALDSPWLSGRVLLLPGALRRPQLGRAVISGAWRRHRVYGGLMLGMGLAMAKGYGVPWPDALAVGLVAGFVSLVGMALNLAVGVGHGSPAWGLAGKTALSLAYTAVCLLLGYGVLDLQTAPGSLWPWVALAAATSLPLLALGCFIALRRWPALDWQHMPARPTWARGLH